MARVIALPTATMDFKLVHAINEVRSTYGDIIDVASKAKSLLKFGGNPDLDASVWETVWENGEDETYVSTNSIDTISSSDAADVGEIIRIEGHTVTGTGSDQQFTFSIQTVVLNGQNKVVLGTPLARVSRISNESETPVAGDVHVYEDTALTLGVPTDLTKSHIVMLGTVGNQQSFKAATTFSNTDYYLLTNVFASVTKGTATAVDFELQIRTAGGIFRPTTRFSLNSAGATTQQVQFDPYIIVPKNADVRVRAVASANNVEVNAAFQGYIASVIGVE